MMSIGSFFEKIFSGDQESDLYEWDADDEGLNFFLPVLVSKKVSEGKAGLKVTHQYIALRMLVEQEFAEVIPNGFIVPTSVAVNLDRDTQELLSFPPVWTGGIVADIQGVTGSANFSIKLSVEVNDSAVTGIYMVNGPILEISPTKVYTLTVEQQKIFEAASIHSISDKTESDNLQLVLALQEAKKSKARINLMHFEAINIKAPKSISIEVEIDDEGDLLLTPFMGQNASHERMQKVLGQIRTGESSSLRVDDEIILFDEKRLLAIQEVLNNRKVSKNDVEQFFKSPGSFIDASLVDLDCGFSVRVHGATAFKHSYFGETEESGIDWFGAKDGSGTVMPASKLYQVIEDSEQLDRLKSLIDDGFNTGADEIIFDNQTFDISDKSSVSEAISLIERKIDGKYDDDCDDSAEDTKEDKNETAVINVELNDEEMESSSESLSKLIDKILYPEKSLNWSNYKRSPYPHQIYGVQWIMGLATAEEGFSGGLMADDMGLGKTFMALSAVEHMYKVAENNGVTKKPCLVVAPLSVIQNWQIEVDETFFESPFEDIVILQSAADLPRFRDGGVETARQTVGKDSIAEIQFSLKVGSKHTIDRLDLPQRLVITTYQTLRDYQFSLCKVDWGMVIFDEAQNIKNPNTLQTRAAMGIKADFKLLATGTPVENSLVDLWCLMQIACANYLGSYQKFRERYIVPILRSAGDELDEIRARIGRELRVEVGSLMLRRLKEDNLKGLPKKTIFLGVDDNDWNFSPLLKSTLSGRQLDVYEATISAQELSDDNIMLASLQRLRDISLHPQLSDQGRLALPKRDKAIKNLMCESGKMNSLLSTLKSIKKRKEKCIIFLVNKCLQEFLSLALGKLYGLGPLLIINGDATAVAKRKSTPTRISMIKSFEAKVGFNIIIMSPIAAGVGLTIVGANNVIHFERHWNPAKEAQATDRVYRIGQKKDVNVFIPIIHHPVYESFDVNLHKLLSTKILLKDSVITSEQVNPRPRGYCNTKIKPQSVIVASDLRKISWEQFEGLCAELFQKEYSSSSCWLTKDGADYGADVVLTSEAMGVVIQCKHTTNVRYEGYKGVQEVSSSALKYSKELRKEIDTMIFATNAKRLSLKIRKLATDYNVKIYSYDDIVQLLNKHSITLEMVLRRLGKNRLKID